MTLFKYVFTLFFCTLLLNAKANYYTPLEKNVTQTVRIKSHSLLASKGSRYQWYLNNIKIDGAVVQELQVTSPGIYKLEMTDLTGEVIEKQTIIGLTNTGSIIRVFTIGDSTVQDYTAGYYPRKGWGQVLPIFFNVASVTIINKAVGGTSSKSFYNLYWTAVRDGLQAGDFVFIQFGINDATNTDTSRYAPTGGIFEGYLTKFVNETRAKGAFPVLVATLRRNAWNADGVTVYDAYHNYPIATRTVAKNMGVPLIDLDAKAKVLLESVGQLYCTRLLYNNYLPGEYPNYPTGNTDDVHFQEMGAIEMAKLVTQGIRDLSADPNVSKLIPFLKPEYQIAVSVNPSGVDSVTTHTTTYPQGLTITLKTIPKTKSTFQKWNTATGTQLSTATLTTVTSGTAATAYTAIYAGSTACVASIAASTATTFCASGSALLTASTGSSYKWFNGTTQVGTAQSYTATATGSYTVEVTNVSGCKATSAATTITVNALPAATINTPATSFCTGGSVILTASAGSSYKWFNGTTQVGTAATYIATTAGAYTVQVTNANGCSATSAAKTITMNPLPVITQYEKIDASSWIAASTATACEASTLNLGPQPNISTGWSWTGPNNFTSTLRTPILTNLASANAGTYTATYIDVNGCKTTSTFALQVSNPTATITSPATSFCVGGSTVLTASTGSSYKWFNGTTQVGTAATYTATVAGGYTVEVTNAAGCSATSPMTQITVNAVPTATINTPVTSFCPGGSAILTASTGSSYKWFNGTTQVGTVATYTATASGAYTVEVTNTSGCKATSTVTTLTVSAAPTASITTPATSFCTGGSVVLTASTGSSYKWFNGTTQVGTVATYTANASGAYTVEVTNTSGCKATSAVTTLTVSDAPTASITTPATSFCTGGSVVLTASTGSSYKWFNGTTQVGTASTYTAITAGAYSVEVTNTSGCKATSTVTTLTVSAAPTASITTPATSFCTGDSVVLTPSPGTSYKWFNGTTQVANTATYTATTAGAYSVEVTNSSECKAISAVTKITSTTSITWYADSDGDGFGDASVSESSCTQPIGYVSIAGDACPTDKNKIAAGNCGCGNTETSCLDCAGTPNGKAFFDNCNICVGGTTGNTACLSTATINGTTANIKVIPQPFDLNTSILLENLGNIQSLTIISASGAIVKTMQGLNTTEITLGEELASGLYSVIIQSDNEMFVTKIVKK
jgi:lysophospholipase L1-like esterase